MTQLDGIQEAFRQLELAARGYAEVSALEGGRFTLPKRLFVSGVPHDETSLVPSLSFLVVYGKGEAGKTKRMLFDLGLRREPAEYTPQIQRHLNNRQPMHHLPDVRMSLGMGGLGPGAIDEVLLSHVHWDHIGTPSDFPGARFMVGHGSLHILKHSTNSQLSHAAMQSDLFDGLDAQELPEPYDNKQPWQDCAGFRILDMSSGRGTLYAVDTPGHLTGHVGLLCRTGDWRWALLVGDACHDVRLLTGEAHIAEWSDSQGITCCIHADKRKAAETLRRLRTWRDRAAGVGLDLQIVFAHDVDWAALNPGAFFPGKM